MRIGTLMQVRSKLKNFIGSLPLIGNYLISGSGNRLVAGSSNYLKVK